jgi:serine/threonine protein kinase
MTQTTDAVPHVVFLDSLAPKPLRCAAMPARGSTFEEDAQGAAGSPLQIGEIVAGKYRIEREIGRGGMGIVLCATHLQLEHLVAIKVMRRDLLEDDQALTRLLVEARAAARIRSEHVARVLDVGTLDGGSAFIVMEYLEGEDLADLLERQGPLDVEQAVQFMLQSCEALAEVHVAEMVHRDLKPGNLFIHRLPDGSPTLKIVDFGISKYIGGSALERAATASQQVLGSPYYMAPEQMRADAVDERSDIWALGTILFEMLTGRTPFVGETLREVYAAVFDGTPPAIDVLKPGIPPGLDDVVQRCLEKDPAQRFCDVADLAEALAPFGGAASAQSVERITRILTNPEPIRARYSAIPPAPGARVSSAPARVSSLPAAPAARVSSLPRAPSMAPSIATPEGAPAQPLSQPGSLGSRRESVRPGRVWAEPAEHHGTSSPPAADLGAVSTTGALRVPAANRSEGAEKGRPRSRTSWIALVLAVVAVAGSWWIRDASRDIAELPPPPASGVTPVPNASAVALKEAENALDARRPPLAAPTLLPNPQNLAAEAPPLLGTEKRALRPAASPARSTKGQRFGVPPVDAPPVDPLILPEQGAPDAAVAGASFAETGSGATAPPALRAPSSRAEDPWNPTSFGERR